MIQHHPVFPVDRHKIFGTQVADHKLQIFATAVTRSVDIENGAVFNLRSCPHQEIDTAVDVLGIPRNR